MARRVLQAIRPATLLHPGSIRPVRSSCVRLRDALVRRDEQRRQSTGRHVPYGAEWRRLSRQRSAAALPYHAPPVSPRAPGRATLYTTSSAASEIATSASAI